MESHECAEMEDGLVNHTNEEVAEDIGEVDFNHERENSKEESYSRGGNVLNKEHLTHYSELLQSSSKSMSLVSSKQVFEEKILELQLLANCCISREIINTVGSHLTSAITVVKAASTMKAPVALSLVVRKQPAPNSNSEKQFRFHSTKKERCKGSRWAKPTIEEQNIAREKMANTLFEVCEICIYDTR